MDVTNSQELLFIVQGVLDEELDFGQFSLEIDEENNDMIEGYEGEVSLNEEYGLVARGRDHEEAVELYEEVRGVLEQDYPDVDFPEPELVNAVTSFYLSVGEGEDLDEFKRYLGELEGVDVDDVSIKERSTSEGSSPFYGVLDEDEISDEATHRVRLYGFDGNVDGSVMEYLAEYIEDF